MSQTIVEVCIAALENSRTLSSSLLDSISDEFLCHQPFRNANHALWTYGHLATVDDYFSKFIGEKETPRFDEWKKLFFAKSLPLPTVEDYPPVSDVKAYFVESRKQLVDWVSGLDDDAMKSPLPGKLSGFKPNLASLLSHLVWHEGMHSGQITVVRKSLGLEPLAM